MTATLDFLTKTSKIKNIALQLKLYLKFRLLRSGDIELNPGPLNFENAIKELRLYQVNLKFLTLNCTSLHKKRERLKTLLKQMDNNTILGLTETWPDANDSDSKWNINNEKFKIFRSHRSPKIVKKLSGGVMLIVPIHFSPRILKNVNRPNKKFYDSLWIEIICSSEPSLLNITYNPRKGYSSNFLEELADCIDDTIKCKSRIVLLGDFNIKYLDEKEKQSLETVVFALRSSSSE